MDLNQIVLIGRLVRDPELRKTSNNVSVAADVRFYEHDVIHKMWNGDPDYKGERIKQYEECISIGDNTVLGARSIVLAGVSIGKNVVVGCGSIVTKDIPDYAIVAGCPAKVIGNTKDLFLKRVGKGNSSENLTYEEFFIQH